MAETILFTLKFFALGVAAHLAVCRLTRSGRFMFNSLLLGLFLMLAAGAWQLRTTGLDPLALYLLLSAWLAYLMFFINLLNSVTLKMLERLAAQPGGTLPARDFEPIFDEESGVKARLADMQRNGFIETGDGQVAIAPKAAAVLRIISLARKVLSVDVIG